MNYILFGIIVIILALIVKKFVKSQNPITYAKGIARAMFVSYLALKKKYPKLTEKEHMIQSLMLRPGFYERKVAEQFYDTVRSQLPKEMQITFNFFVYWLVLDEFKNKVLGKYDYNSYNEEMEYADKFRKGVDDIIPKENYFVK